jgi:hypothetical protein
MTDLRYPIRRFDVVTDISDEERKGLIQQIEDAPAKLRAAVKGLSNEQLDTPYRPEGWTVRQLVHHLPDSHINAYVRMKLALTEENPAIKTYDEALWAGLIDTQNTPLEVSLDLLDALHKRWVVLMRSVSKKDYARTFQHPEWGAVPIDMAISIYAWHGLHHVAHITSLRERMGWS